MRGKKQQKQGGRGGSKWQEDDARLSLGDDLDGRSRFTHLQQGGHRATVLTGGSAHRAAGPAPL